MQINILRPSESDPYAEDPQATLIKHTLVNREGRMYQEIDYICKLSLTARIVKLFQAIGATILDAGTGLLISDFAYLYDQGLSGEIHIRVRKEISFEQNKSEQDIAQEKFLEVHIDCTLQHALVKEEQGHSNINEWVLEELTMPVELLDFLPVHYTSPSYLERAAIFGNMCLIDRVTQFVGKSFFLQKCPPGLLYYASICKDPEKGYHTVRALLQLGFSLSADRFINLSDVLKVVNMKIAALFLRHGIVPSKDIPYKKELKKAKKEIMTENEKLFKIHFNELWLLNEADSLPNDILNIILSLSIKLELQD